MMQSEWSFKFQRSTVSADGKKTVVILGDHVNSRTETSASIPDNTAVVAQGVFAPQDVEQSETMAAKAKARCVLIAALLFWTH